jgi:hypothetical protein
VFQKGTVRSFNARGERTSIHILRYNLLTSQLYGALGVVLAESSAAAAAIISAASNQ